jgi:hypothetical protein
MARACGCYILPLQTWGELRRNVLLIREKRQRRDAHGDHFQRLAGEDQHGLSKLDEITRTLSSTHRFVPDGMSDIAASWHF